MLHILIFTQLKGYRPVVRLEVEICMHTVCIYTPK